MSELRDKKVALATQALLFRSAILGGMDVGADRDISANEARDAAKAAINLSEMTLATLFEIGADLRRIANALEMPEK